MMRMANPGHLLRLLLAAALLGSSPAVLHAQISGTQQRAHSLLAPVVTPSLMNFSALAVGDVSAGQTVTVKNKSAVPVQVLAVQFQGPGAGEFQFSLAQPAVAHVGSLARLWRQTSPHQNCRFRIRK